MNPAVGLVGFGLAGRVFHAPLIRASGMEIVGVVSRQREAVSGMLPAARVCADLAALLALPRLDLVVIATPNDLHEAQALASLAAGKHVVVDKPMALHAAGVERMMRVAGETGRLLAPFHNRRWDSDFLTVQKTIGADQLGPVHTYEAYWDRYRPRVPDRWRESDEHGGGLLFDLGTHLIDQALVLFGMPEWLQADVFCQRAGATVDDAFEIRMGRGRLRIVLGASALAASPRPRFRVSGDRACYIKHGVDPQEDQLRAGLTPHDAEFGVESAALSGQLISGESPDPGTVRSERGCWTAFYDAMRAGIETGSPPPASASQAHRVLQVIEAARHSSRTGALVTLAAVGSVQAATPWVEGQHYFLVSPPQPTTVAKDKVEVLEVFSYGCPACNHFYPVIDKLKLALPANAQMRYLPASWHPEEDWKVFQRAYFAASSLGIADKLHDRVFDAVWKTGELATMDGNNMKNPLPSLADVAQFYEREAKLKPGEFLGAAHSFSVDAQMRQADEQIKAYQTDMTPTLIIDGKYRLTPRSAGGSDEFVALAKWLVDQSSKKVQSSTKPKSP